MGKEEERWKKFGTNTVSNYFEYMKIKYIIYEVCVKGNGKTVSGAIVTVSLEHKYPHQVILPHNNTALMTWDNSHAVGKRTVISNVQMKNEALN